MTGQESLPPILGQVGPRYGVRDFMRSIDTSWQKGMEDAPWVAPAEAELKVRSSVEHRAQRIIDSILASAAGPAIMSYETINGKRLGKPYVQITTQIGQSAVIGTSKHLEEAIILKDCIMQVEVDRVVGTINPGRFVMTRHALERLYEREGVPTGGMPDAIRNTVADTRRSIAFSTITGMTIGDMLDPSLFGSHLPIPASALQLVPCSGGLLIVEVVPCVFSGDKYALIRLETRRSGTFARGTPSRDPMTKDIVVNGIPIQIAPIHVGRTYLSWDMLRSEQREYVELFRNVVTSVDLNVIVRQVFGARDMHKLQIDERPHDLPDVTRLQDLLPHCATRPDRGRPIWDIRPGRMSDYQDDLAAAPARA